MHIYQGGTVIDDGINLADSLGSTFYSALGAFFPFTNQTAKLELAPDMPFTVRINWSEGLDSDVYIFPLEDVILDAISQDVPYPNRIRLGETEFGAEELVIDLIVEWK